MSLLIIGFVHERGLEKRKDKKSGRIRIHPTHTLNG